MMSLFWRGCATAAAALTVAAMALGSWATAFTCALAGLGFLLVEKASEEVLDDFHE